MMDYIESSKYLRTRIRQLIEPAISMIFDEGDRAVQHLPLSLDVPDLDRAIAFYGDLFGQAPAKRKPGYAKFELADPPVALAFQQAGRPALSHLGIRVGGTKRWRARHTTPPERARHPRRTGQPCCYARQDKVWVADPAGNRWEVYTVLGDIEEDDHREATAACCTPVAGESPACCA